MAGRPSLRTPAAQHKICEALRAGNTRRAASIYGGMSEDTFGRWLKADADFAAAIEKAETDAHVRNVAIIQKAAQDTWTAAAWWLERKFPQDWARREKHEHTGDNGAPLTIRVEYADTPIAAAPSGTGAGSEGSEAV